MSDSKYVIEFDHRSDDGPRLVGPFYTRAAANRWVEAQRFDLAEFGISHLWQPPRSEQG